MNDGTVQDGWVEAFTGEDCRAGRALCDALGVAYTGSLGVPQRCFVRGSVARYLHAVLATVPAHVWPAIHLLAPLSTQQRAALTAMRALDVTPERWAAFALQELQGALP